MEDSDQKTRPKAEIVDCLTISQPDLIRIVLHDQKMAIMGELMKEMKNIQELAKATQLNPGTVKRNLEELMVQKLVFIAETKFNDYNIKMTYYQAAAKKIKIDFQF